MYKQAVILGAKFREVYADYIASVSYDIQESTILENFYCDNDFSSYIENVNYN